MKDKPIVAALPVGEFDAEPVQSEFDAMLNVFRSLSVELFMADPASTEADSRAVVQAFSEKHPDLLLVIPLRGRSAQAIEAAVQASQAPCLIWPVNGRFALPSSALALGALREVGYPVELLYAPSDHPDAMRRIACVIRAAAVYHRLRKSRIGIVGGLFPNLVACRYDPQIVSSRLGVSLQSIPYDRLRQAIQSVSQHRLEAEQTRQSIAGSYTLDTVDGSSLEAGVQLHLAMKHIAQEQRLDGYATECWTGLPAEIGLNPCLGFIEDAYTLACEGDVMLCISLLIARYLTGKNVYAGDLYDLDLDGNLTLVHCGAPASLASQPAEVLLGKSQMALDRGFVTLACRPRLEPGRVTIFRFYGGNCDQLHLASGDLLGSEQSPSLCVRIKLSEDRWAFLDECFGNHYVVVPGDIRAELKLLGKWLGITIHECQPVE